MPAGVVVKGSMGTGFANILTPDALNFVANLNRGFSNQREMIIQKRKEKQSNIDKGQLPHFLPETAHIRNGNWTIAAAPKDLQDRRVEITGPAGDRKMVINALNSGAKMFM